MDLPPMSPPMKPWENARVPEVTVLGLNSSGPGGRVVVSSSVPQARPPPLPPRGRPAYSQPPLYNPSPYSHLGGFSSSYFPSSYSTPYYSPFGTSAFRRSPADDFQSRFVQLAEESSQPAFNSIESFVRTFSSMTMMLESSFQAMYMSFRAVLSMADNMSKMRSMFINFLSNLTILRSLYWIYRKLLYLLGLVSENPLREQVWASAEKTVVAGPPSQRSSSWPVIAFFGLLFGAPYLMLKLSPSVDDDEEETKATLVAAYDFKTPSRGELPFSKGDVLVVTFKRRSGGGWGVAQATNGQTGLVPLNYLVPYKQNVPKPVPEAQPEPL